MAARMAKAEAEAARLFQLSTLAELGAAQARVREQIAEQGGQLRDMVGAKHAALLECLDAVDAMAAAAAEGAQQAGSAGRLCARVEEVGERVAARAAAPAPPAEGARARASGGASLRLAVVGAAAFVDGAVERAWAALEEGEPMRAAWIFIAANALALEPELGDALGAQPELGGAGARSLVGSVGVRTAPLRAELLAAAEELARAPAQRPRARAHALGALVLLGGWSDGACLQLLFSAAEEEEGGGGCGGGGGAAGRQLRLADSSGLVAGDGAHSAAARLGRRARALRDGVVHAHRLLGEAAAAEDGQSASRSDARAGGGDVADAAAQPATELERTLALFCAPPAYPPLASARAPRRPVDSAHADGGAHGAGRAERQEGSSEEEEAEEGAPGEVAALGRPARPAARLGVGALALSAACAGLAALPAALRTPAALRGPPARSLSAQQLALAVGAWWDGACARARAHAQQQLAAVATPAELSRVAAAVRRGAEGRGSRARAEWERACAALAPGAREPWRELWRPLLAQRGALIVGASLGAVSVGSELRGAVEAACAQLAAADGGAAGGGGEAVGSAVARVRASLRAQLARCAREHAVLVGSLAGADEGAAEGAGAAPADGVEAEGALPELRPHFLAAAAAAVSAFAAEVDAASAALRAQQQQQEKAASAAGPARPDGAATRAAEGGLCLGTAADAVLADGVCVKQMLLAAAQPPQPQGGPGAQWNAAAAQLSAAAERARLLWVEHAAALFSRELCGGGGSGGGLYALPHAAARGGRPGLGQGLASLFGQVALPGSGGAEDSFRLPLAMSAPLSAALLALAAECAAAAGRGHGLGSGGALAALRDSVWRALLDASDASEAAEAAGALDTADAAPAAGSSDEACSLQAVFDLKALQRTIGSPHTPELAAAVEWRLRALGGRLDPVDWAMSAPLLAAAAHEHSLRTAPMLAGPLAQPSGGTDGTQAAHLAAVRAAMQAAQRTPPVAPPCGRFLPLPVSLPPLDEPEAGATEGTARARGRLVAQPGGRDADRGAAHGGLERAAAQPTAAAAKLSSPWAAWFGPAL